MYGKLMCISDELMWRYWTFLTDLPQIADRRDAAQVERGELHPMQVKKELAETITAGFHSAEAARHAADRSGPARTGSCGCAAPAPAPRPP